MRRDGGCGRRALIVALAIFASLFVIGFCLSLIADDEASEPTQENATPKVVTRVVTRIVTVEVRVKVTPTATIAKPTESSPTVEPTLELAPSIVRSGKGQSGGQIDLPAGVYQIHFWVTENDRSFARDRYELTLISRSGRNAPITIEGSDSSARESVRYDNPQDDLLFYEVDLAENGSWQIEIVQTGAALPTPTPIPATPTPTSTKEADPTSEASTTPAATPTSTPTPLREYEVQVGDTLSAIAERFGVEVSDLISANDIADPNVIQAGFSLVIPATPSSVAVGTTSTVQPTSATQPTPTVPSVPDLSGFDPHIAKGLQFLTDIQDKVPRLPEVVAVLLKSRIAFADLPQNMLGRYSLQDRSILLDDSLRDESRVVIGMVLAHEGLHALDHTQGSISTSDGLFSCFEIRTGESSLEIDVSDFAHEIRAFDIELALWKATYGWDGKPGELTETEQHYNTMLRIKRLSSGAHRWLIRLRYLFECVT